MLVVTGCDRGAELSGPDGEEELVEGITARGLANPDHSFDEATAECVARGIVDEFGVDGLAELGVTAENPDLLGGKVFPTPEDGRRVVDLGMECISVPEAIASFLPADVNLLDESVSCLANGLQTDRFRDLLAGIIVTGAQPSAILDSAEAVVPIGILFFDCLSADEILRVGDLFG